MDIFEVRFNAFPTLHTQRLLLREMTLDDAPEVFAMRSNPEVMRYLARPLQTDMGDAVKWVENVRQSFERNEGVNWGICLKEQPERHIGTISFWRFDLLNQRAEIGYMLQPEYWGKGYAGEAMEACIEYCFNVLKFRAIEANTDPRNDASGRLLEKFGFAQEALFRENYFFDGEFLDSRIYALLNPNRSPALKSL